MKTGQKFCKIYFYDTVMSENVVLIVHGNAKMADLNVANVDIHILLKLFDILLEYLRKTKGNFWNILLWVFLFIG